MSKLLMEYKDIRNNINLKLNNWKNIKTTNCYAFAMGLDIPYDKICSRAYSYSLGEMGKYIYDLSSNEIYVIPYKYRFMMDMDALDIKVSEANQFDKSLCDIDSDGYLSWLIALYQKEAQRSKDLHMLRKSPDGIWYHKRGYKGKINNKDDKGIIIKDLDQASIEYHIENKQYKMIGVYNLRLKK